MGHMGRMETTAPRLGCRGVVLTMGLALVLPFFVDHCPGRTGRLSSRLASEPRATGPGGGAPVRPAARLPACLEAWVFLRGYGGCPVLVGAGGYRLGLFCGAAGLGERRRGLLAFAGPFAGQAYLSQLPVPLGRWVHLAGMEPGDPWAGAAASSFSPSSPLVAFDGVDVTAGRPLAGAAAFPLGRDPWSGVGADVATIAARRPPAARGVVADGGMAARGETPRARLDGRLGAWRLSRRWRSVAEVAAARGTPWRFGALRPPGPGVNGPEGVDRPGREAEPGKSGPRLGGLTLRGWLIVAVSLLLAGGMLAIGLSLRVPQPGSPPRAWWSDASLRASRGRRRPVDLGVLRRDRPPPRRRLTAGERTPGRRAEPGR
jgi:hypothetical protein